MPILDLSQYDKLVMTDISLNNTLFSESNMIGLFGLTGGTGPTGIIGPTGPTGSAATVWTTNSSGDIYFDNLTSSGLARSVYITDDYSTAITMGTSNFRVFNTSSIYTNFSIGSRTMYIGARPDQANTGYTPFIWYRCSNHQPSLEMITAYNNFNHWIMRYGGGDYFDFIHISSYKGYIRYYSSGYKRMNFTGQHRTFVNNVHASNITSYIGLIVCANKDTYININSKTPDYGNKAINVNDSAPLLSLSNKEKDKTVFGVISDCEHFDREGYRSFNIGNFGTTIEKEYGDHRINVNSVGEGGIWVSNKNGPLASGEYITSSLIPGYGQRQDSEFLANYTVAKITMNCDFHPKLQYKKRIIMREVDFTSMDPSGNYYDVSGNALIYTKQLNEYPEPKNPISNDYHVILDNSNNLVSAKQNILDSNNEIQWEDTEEQEYQYNLRYIDISGNILSKAQYDEAIINNEDVYIAAFVGCTYHCG